jgi:hypothetical protein
MAKLGMNRARDLSESARTCTALRSLLDSICGPFPSPATYVAPGSAAMPTGVALADAVEWTEPLEGQFTGLFET